jgi:hypothetical protein
MAAGSINFTRADVKAAINAALGKVQAPHMIRAINRAAANLAAGQFAYDGRQVTLRSASSTRVYRIDTREPMTCSCTAHERGLVCWHVVAARLLVRAAERHAAQRAACPMCGAAIEVRQYHIGGKGYQFFEVCAGDGSHYAKAA